VVAPRKTPRFPSLPGASGPGTINNALLDHFFPPTDPLPNRGRLKTSPSATSLTEEEMKLALSKSYPSSALGPDGIPYSVWKKVNLINPSTLLELPSPLVAFGYHHPSLKTANRVVLDKAGKASYDLPASFRIIVLFKTISKILERVMTVRLTAIARSKGLPCPLLDGRLGVLLSFRKDLHHGSPRRHQHILHGLGGYPLMISHHPPPLPPLCRPLTDVHNQRPLGLVR